MKKTELEKAYRYCESVTRLHAKSFYFAAKFLPRRKQQAVYAIYAFCRHVDDEIDETGEKNEAESIAAVEIWEANLEEVYFSAKREDDRERGRPGDGEKSEPAHDQTPKTKNQRLVFSAWRDLLKTYRIPRELPLELIKGVTQDTRIKRYQSFDELYVYCYRVASTVGLMSAEVLGYESEKALDEAEALGVAMQLTNILRDVKEDAERGRIYLPQEDLRAFRVSEDQILAGRFDANFAGLMKFEIARAREFYQKGERGIALLERDSRFTVLLASRIYAKILDEIEKQNYDVFIRRAGTTKTQKLLSLPKIWFQANRF